MDERTHDLIAKLLGENKRLRELAEYLAVCRDLSPSEAEEVFAEYGFDYSG